MQVEKSLDWLPSGWKVEVKERKTGYKDKYYTDSASGNTFRSRREVSHYLQTGEVPNKTRKKRFMNDADSIRQETSQKKLSSSNTRGYLFSGQSSYTSKRNEEWMFRLSVTKEEESSCSETNRSDKRCVLALHTPAIPPANQLGENGVGKHQNRVSQPAPLISETRKQLTLAGMEPEPIPDVGKYDCTPPAKSGEEVDHTEKGGHCLRERKNELGKVLHDQIAGEGVDHTEKGGHCLGEPENELGTVLYDQIAGEGVNHTQKGGHCLGEPKNELGKELGKILHDQIAGEGVNHTEKGGHCLGKLKNELGKELGKTLHDQIAGEGVDRTEKSEHCRGNPKNEFEKFLHDQIAAPREPYKKLLSEKPESRSTLQFSESFLQKVLQDQGAAPEEHMRKTGSEKPDLQITLRFREPSLDPCLGFISKTTSKT